MRIGIFDPYLDDLGGGEKYMMTIATCLSRRHAVSIFWDNEKDVKELSERFSLDLSKIALHKNIFSPRISTWDRMRTSSSFDVICVLSDGSIPFVLSKKLYLHFQQPMEHIRYLSTGTRLKLVRVASIFCNSKFTKQFIDKTFHQNSRVVYPPVDLQPKKVKKENIILHVGRFRLRDIIIGGVPVGDFKKQAVLIKVFKEMVGEGLKGWRFVLATSVKEEDKEAFAKMQKEASGFPIEFLINQNNKKLWVTYNKAKIYWHASGFGEDLTKNPELAEHFGISTVEAMGGGAVPVVINAGGQPEIVDDGENGFLWNTISELKEKTIRLIQDPKLLAKLEKNGRVKAELFNEQRFCKEIYELLEA